jgi:hypothetical protein
MIQPATRVAESHGSMLGRIAALVAGLAILLATSLPTIGVGLSAPLGIWVAHRIQRARGRTLGVWQSWIGAVSGATLALFVVGATIATMLPPGTWHTIRQTADSASAEAAKQPPPAWVNRIAPPANRYSMPDFRGSPTLNTVTMVWGLALGVCVFGAVLGTVAWVGATLLVFCASGHWWREASPIEIDPHAA